MYKENLVMDIQKSKDDSESQEMLGELYYANLGLIIQIGHSCGMTVENHDDFMQLAYLALVKAVQAFNPKKGFSFLSYYRMCFRHECYQFWLQFGGGKELVTESVNTDYIILENYNKMNEEFDMIELELMNQILWDRVEKILSARDVSIIKQRFCDGCTLRKIASGQDISTERVRQRIIKVCKVLHDDRDIQSVAEFYGWRV